jgi:hypothetical protein
MTQSAEELARAAREAAERAIRDAKAEAGDDDAASRAKPRPKPDQAENSDDTTVVTHRRRPPGGKR